MFGLSSFSHLSPANLGILLGQLQFERMMAPRPPEPPSGVPFDIWHERACRIVNKRSMDRTDTLKEGLHGFRGSKHDLLVLVPERRLRRTQVDTHDEIVNIRLMRLLGTPVVPIIFKDWVEGTSSHVLGVPDTIELKKRISELNQLINSNANSPGEVTKIGKALRVKLSQRRIANIPQDEIALLVALHHEDPKSGWRASSIVPHFYLQYLLPTLESAAKSDPAAWAAHCTAVTLGYSICEHEGQDCPPWGVEYGYSKVASITCNLRPSEHQEPRDFPLTQQLKKLIASAGMSKKSDGFAEMVAFLAQNQETLSPKSLSAKSFIRFTKALPLMLNNGLNIDRVSQLYESFVAQGIKPSRALSYCSRIVINVFSHNRMPWWFKEDFDLRKTTPPELSPSIFARQLCKLSKIAGPAYETAATLILPYPKNISAVDSCNSSHLFMRLAVQVAKQYGIGNPKRGAAVLEFAVESLACSAEQDQPFIFQKISGTIARHKPDSVVTGILEGSDLSFHKPGLFGVIASFGHEEELKRLKKFEGNLGVPELRLMHRGFSLPIAERASLPAVLAVNGFEQQPLIASSLFSSTPLLSAPEETIAKVRASIPVQAWMAFDEQVAREVNPWERDEIASIYMNFLARKMANPLSPPAGLLRLIGIFKNIHNPNYEMPSIARYEDRGEACDKNARSQSTRYELLSDLADAILLGLLNEKQFIKVLSWIVAPLNPENLRHHQSNIMAITLKSRRESWEYEVNSWAEKCFDAERTLSEIETAITKEQYLYGKASAWLEEDREKLKRHIKLLSLGIDPQDSESKHRVKLPYTLDEKAFSDELESRMETENSIARTTQNNSRISYLMNGMAIVKSVNLLVSSRQISSADGREVLSSFLEVALNDDSSSAPLGEVEVLAFRELPQALGDFYAAGLPEIFRRHGIENKTGIFPFPVRHIRAFAELRARLDVEEQRLANEPATNLANRLNLAQTAAEKQVRQFLEGLEVRPEEVKLILSTLFWPSRYSEVVPALEKTNLILTVPASDTWSNATSSLNESARFVNLAAQIGSQLSQRPVQPPLISKQSNWHEALEALEGWEHQLLNHVQDSPLLISDSAHSNADVMPWDLASDQIRDTVLQWRRDDFGLRVPGLKSHVLHPFDVGRVNFLVNWLGFKSTSFRLIHANDVLLIPPMPSSKELKLMISFLVQEGVIQSGQPELQVTVSGRLNREHCAFYGATILLATGVGARYTADSFKTTHNDLTGMRLVLFDAPTPGCKRHKFLFDAKDPGRTDILGRIDPNDIDRGRRIVTVLGDYEESGNFGDFAGEFKRNMREILGDHRMGHILLDSWTHHHSPAGHALNAISRFDADNTEDGIRHFHTSIEPCVNAWFSCMERYRETGERSGIIFDVRNVLDKLEEKIKIRQQDMLEDPKYKTERDLWFSFNTEW